MNTPPLSPNSPLLQGLNEAQSLAVSSFDGPLLVVAGPGSGKTRVLTHRIAALVECGVPEESILAVTFTNKASLEMRERLAAMLGSSSGRRLWVGTFHSVGLRLLRRHSSLAGLGENFTVLDADDARRLVKSCMEELSMQIASGDLKDTHSLISRAKNDGLSPEAASLIGKYASVAEVYATYQRKLKEMSAVDFDDLLGLALSLLESNPAILERYKRHFSHILVDEFQDTNLVQYRLVQLLASGHRNLCVVGDPAQSIYSWRGSHPAVVDEFVQDFSPTVVVLGENYRSTPEIVEVCDALLSGSPSSFDRKLTTSNPHGDPVRFWVHKDDRDENDEVVMDIKRLPPLSSAAIIARTNAQTRGFEESLVRSGISYVVVGTLRFYERLEVRDALAYLRVALNDKDALSLARVANTPRRGLGPAAWELLAVMVAGKGSVVEALSALVSDPSAKRYSSGFSGLLDDLLLVREACEVSLPEAVSTIYDRVGLKEYYAASKDGGEDRVENLGELLNAANEFISPSSQSVTVEGVLVSSLSPVEQVRAFLESTALASGSDTDSSSARVVLTTAHAAKGREFDHVYVVGVEDGLFPHVSSEDFEEERRLLFVALSRARLSLTVSRCLQRMMFGQRNAAKASPFLSPFKEAEPPRRVVSSSLRSRPRPPEDRLSASLVPPGTLVQHHVFGVGEVQTVDAETVTVKFGKVSRQLRLDMAPLKLVQPE